MLYCDKYQESLVNSEYKILIVEDSEFVNDTVAKTLGDMGYTCAQALDYKTASKKLQDAEYDFIVLDLNLPDFNGFELLSNIKNNIAIPTIVISA